jgi:hypothetical protein
MYNIDYAHRYLEYLTTAEIARLIRAQIVDEVADGQLPDLTYEVVEDPNGDNHIEVMVKDYTGKVFNKRAVELDEELGKTHGDEYQALWTERKTLPIYDLDLDLLLKAVLRLVNQWVYEDGPLPVEHFVYTCKVALDPVLILADFAKVREEIAAAK